MKKGYPLILTGIVFLILHFIFPFHMILPAWSSWSGSEAISPGENKGPNLGLFWGGIIVGSVHVSGGNNDVYFYIKDSAGRTVFDPGTIYDDYSFHWSVPKTDSYRFSFDNSMSWFTSKSVNWNLSLYYYNVIFVILGILFSISGVLVAFKEGNVLQRIKTWRAKGEE